MVTGDCLLMHHKHKGRCHCKEACSLGLPWKAPGAGQLGINHLRVFLLMVAVPGRVLPQQRAWFLSSNQVHPAADNVCLNISVIRATLHRLKSQLCISHLRPNSWPDDRTSMNSLTCFSKLFLKPALNTLGRSMWERIATTAIPYQSMASLNSKNCTRVEQAAWLGGHLFKGFNAS